MPKTRKTVVEASTSSQEEYGGESIIKKKKKRRKRTDSPEEEEQESSSAPQKSPPLFDISFSQLSSSASPGPSPSNKKKKKKKKRGEQGEDATVNGTLEKKRKKMEEEEEEAGQGKKKKRALAVVEADEEEEAAAAAAAAAANKKRRKREKEEEPPENKMEEAAAAAAVVVKKSTKKEKKMKTSPAAAAATSTTSASQVASKRKVKVEVEEEEEMEEVEEEEEDGVWPEEVTQELLFRVTQQLPAEGKDNRSCRVTIKGVDWEAAAPPGHSPEASREQFMRLFKKINAFKTLTTMLKEMTSMVESGLGDRRNRPTLPIHRFMKDFLTPEVKAALKRKGESIIKATNRAWKILPETEKEKYKRSYEEDCARLKPKATDKPEPPVKLPKLPYQICWDAQSNTASTVRSRTHYASLAPQEQVPFIRKSLEDMMRYPADLDTYCATHPDYEPPACPALPKPDLKTYLGAYGCPDMPPPRSTQIFYWEALEKGLLSKVSGEKRMMASLKMFKQLSQQEKEKYKKKLEQARQQYDQQLKKWQGEQDHVTLFAFKCQEAHHHNPLKNVAKDKSHHIKADDMFPHKAPAITSCPKFLGEPPRPVASPYRLFTLKFRTSADTTLSGPELQRALKSGWKALTQDEVAVYVCRCRALHKLYEKEVKDYVSELDTKDRRLFLGFNRVPLFRLFGNRDVFAEEFPNSKEYPVFVKGLQQQPSSPTKPQTDSEEEEEEFNLAIPGPRKMLTPLRFSSLKSPPPPFKKQPPATQAISPRKKSKAPVASVSESEDSSEEEDVKVTRPSAPSSTRPKKKVLAATIGKKTKAAPAPKVPVSESEEEEDEDSDEAEDITPAWRSASTPAQPKRQQQDVESSSSGFSDSDVDG